MLVKNHHHAMFNPKAMSQKEYDDEVKDEQVNTLSEDAQRQLYLPDDTLKAFEYYSIGLRGR